MTREDFIGFFQFAQIISKDIEKLSEAVKVRESEIENLQKLVKKELNEPSPETK